MDFPSADDIRRNAFETILIVIKKRITDHLADGCITYCIRDWVLSKAVSTFLVNKGYIVNNDDDEMTISW